MRSPNTTNATSAANSTVMLFAIAPMPAGARSAPHANSENGIAEFSEPISAKRSQCCARDPRARAPEERQQDRDAGHEPHFDQRQRTEVGRGDAHEQERAAPDRAEQDQLDRRPPIMRRARVHAAGAAAAASADSRTVIVPRSSCDSTDYRRDAENRKNHVLPCASSHFRVGVSQRHPTFAMPALIKATGRADFSASGSPAKRAATLSGVRSAGGNPSALRVAFRDRPRRRRDRALPSRPDPHRSP